MIPISEDERIIYEDKESKMRYFIKPMCGDAEYETNILLLSIKDENDRIKTAEITDKLFNLFVTGWESIEGKQVVKFPEDNRPSKHFNAKFKGEIVYNVILKSGNKLDDESKKN